MSPPCTCQKRDGAIDGARVSGQYMIVQVMLSSRFAMWMSWGPELTFLYNDAYAKMSLGKKHPWALGKPSHKVWEEIWHDIGPRIRKVLETGQATWDDGCNSSWREADTAKRRITPSYSPLATNLSFSSSGAQLLAELLFQLGDFR
jgi:hypothetical protein